MNGTKQTIDSTPAISRNSKSPRGSRKKYTNGPVYNDEKKYDEFIEAFHLKNPSPAINVESDYIEKTLQKSRVLQHKRYRTQ